MIPCTSGEVIFEDEYNIYEIHRDVDEVRRKASICPQHNLLFADLTVNEHLIFVAKVSVIVFSYYKETFA